jgi:hypothetical protein
VAAAAIGLGGEWQANKYQIKPLPPGFDPIGDVLDDDAYKSLPTYFMGLEDSELSARNCCGPNRGFTMHVKDASGADVLRFKRPYKCTFPLGVPCCFTYCNAQEMDIYTMAPGGMEGPRLGSIRETGTCFGCSYNLEVLDATGQIIYGLSAYGGQCGPNCCCREFEFKIETPDGTNTGASIKNVFPGCNFRGMCSRADNLQVAFPSTASPEQRAVLLAATIFLDYLFFEKRGDTKDA